MVKVKCNDCRKRVIKMPFLKFFYIRLKNVLDKNFKGFICENCFDKVEG